MTQAARRHPNVVHHSEVKPVELSKGSKYAMSDNVLGRATGAKGIGCSLYEVPPGKTAFPNHYHCANEEAIYILSGTGTIRLGDARVAVRAGDWIAMPIGPDHAHQMINDGKEPLIYLCVSTAHKCEVVLYPDSGKLGLWAGPSPMTPWIRTIKRNDESLDYWDSEPGAQ